MRKFIASIFAFLLLFTPVLAQTLPEGGLQRFARRIAAGVACPSGERVGLLVKASQPWRQATAFRERGWQVEEIGQGMLAVRLPKTEVSLLSSGKGLGIALSRRHRLLTDVTREATGVELVQTGVELESPFTGKGVVVGVIDEGFQYDHAAFCDSAGRTRIKAVWSGYADGEAPTTDVPSGSDPYHSAGGHGTHVASIAAGSRVAGSAYCGMAPSAELVLISSDLEDDEILAQMGYVKSLAEAQGKPWVVNMSFGSHTGPHDGRDAFSQAANAMLGQGGIVVAAVGNEGGDALHCSHTFYSDADTVALLVSGVEICLDLWCSSADSLSHIAVRPFIYADQQRDYMDEAFWQSVGFTEISPSNCKQHFNFEAKASVLRNTVGTTGRLGLEVWGEAGTTFHAWTDVDLGKFVQPSAEFLKGDDAYLVCEGGATIPQAIAVGAYVARNQIRNVKGNNLSFTSTYPLGQIASFSSRGPYLGEGRKPDVIAPGTLIVAALDAGASGFSATGSTVVQKVAAHGTNNFYGYKNGTSMSTPVVTGIVALWLEACPTLTPAQIKDIMRETAMQDAFTTEADRAGFGKISAYEGLKAALRLAETTGLVPAATAGEGITLLRQEDAWRVMVGESTPWITVRLVSADGREAFRCCRSGLRAGDEVSVPLSSRPRGIYVLETSTPQVRLSRKIVLR